MDRVKMHTPSAHHASECVLLGEHMPPFGRQVLVCGQGLLEFGYLIKKRSGTVVFGVSESVPEADAAGLVLDEVRTGKVGESAPETWPEGHFDTIIWSSPQAHPQHIVTDAQRLGGWLSPEGYFFCLLPNAQYWRRENAENPPETPLVEDFIQRCAEAGLLLYQQWPEEDRKFLDTPIQADGCVHIEDKAVPVGDETARQRKGAVTFLLLFVKGAYDPIRHADRFFNAGRPDWSYEVLRCIPGIYLQDPQTHAAVATEMLVNLLHWARASADKSPLWFLLKAQHLFYVITDRAPLMHPAYRAIAEMWRMIGDTDMATRVLETIQHAAPEEGVAKQLEILSALPRNRHVETPPPEWTAPERPPRILYILHPRIHYGLDVLYDGLCSVLGDGRVIDFPYKASLHGMVPEDLKHYPCTFDRPGIPASLEKVLDELRSGQFDFILYGDCELSMPQEEARRIIEAAGATPVYLVDALDECVDVRQLVGEYIGLSAFRGYFKREMLAAMDYGPHVFPMPFGYPDNRIGELHDAPRERPLFWAGHRHAGLRRLYLERIEAMLGQTFNEDLPQESYLSALQNTRIGLNCFGHGFDTVRYWELPAQGCMLLSEQLPIHVSDNFRDGESAIFFRNLGELEERLTYYLAHPAESAAIAAAGHAHLRRYHTGSARARQLLGWISQTL